MAFEDTVKEFISSTYNFLIVDHLLSTIVITSLIFIFLLLSRLDCSPILKIYSFIYPNKKKFKDKVVWIVGSSTGIGAAMAEEFAKISSKLVLTATTKNALEEVKQKCLNLNNKLKEDDILILPYDITDYNANRESLKIVLDKFGEVDVLVCNAGRIGTETSTSGIEDDLAIQRKMFNINYFANIYLTKLVVKHWIDTKSTGLKICAATSSIAQYSNAPFFSTYIATKMSLCSFYRDLTLQTRKHNISVCLIVPGPTKTQLSNKALGADTPVFTDGNVNKMDPNHLARLAMVAMSNNFTEVIITEAIWLFSSYIAIYLNYEIFLIFKYFNLIKSFEKQFLEQRKQDGTA